jgi:hypothetical protein
VAYFLGQVFGAILLTVALREVFFAKDERRESFLYSALIAAPLFGVISMMGKAEGGVVLPSDAMGPFLLGLLLALISFVWIKFKGDAPYVRYRSVLIKIFSWFWLLLFAALLALKVSTGFK